MIHEIQPGNPSDKQRFSVFAPWLYLSFTTLFAHVPPVMPVKNE